MQHGILQYVPFLAGEPRIWQMEQSAPHLSSVHKSSNLRRIYRRQLDDKTSFETMENGGS